MFYDSETYSNFQILVNPIDNELAKYARAFVGFLFNEPEHIGQQADNQWFSFYLLDSKNKKLVARFSVCWQGAQGFSPARAPFGSIELGEDLNLEILHWYWQFIEDFLLKKNIQSLEIKNYPFAYAPSNATHLTNLFLQNGFQIVQTDLNYHIPISLLGFEPYLAPMELRRLRKCQKNGFYFQKWDSPDLAIVYEFILKARTRKNYPMSLNYIDFESLFLRFPADFQVFTLSFQGELAALTVAVSVNQDILYNFYPADEAKFLTFSPLVMLHQGLYDYALANAYKILDLGIATDHSKPNFGLVQFKRKLGSQASLKLSFRKIF
ncbi:MAG: GNAT family N-acetyltransferase [Microscillaceae bacterium]|jgi:hypothetical protein|nr:GNAT family N-acetyltransferase [Microscillaceae bacterium]